MSDNPVFDRIQTEIDENLVTLFMKGTPMFPQCGFSSAVVQALTMMGVKFKGVKQFSDWPTIPQLYVKGEFVGGCDIIREMFETGELKKVFDENDIEYSEVQQ